MLSLIGLLLTLIGGLIVLVPDRPLIYDSLHHVPPFSDIRKAERRLFDDKESLTREDAGFSSIEAAILHSSQPYDSSGQFGVFRDYGAEFPTDNGTIHVDYEDCRVVSVEQIGDDFLSNSDFRVLMVPDKSEQSVQPLIETNEQEIAVIETEIPNGRFPNMVRDYKRGILSKWGMVLLVIGFLMGSSAILF